MQEQKQQIVRMMAEAHNRGGRIYLCGNGGDAALADHFAVDLLKFAGVSAFSLCSSPSLITMIANDYGYPHVFAWQLERMAFAGDLLVCLSTSGKSENVLMAARYAGLNGIGVISIVGEGARACMEEGLEQYSDIMMILHGNSGPAIEDMQNTICHEISLLRHDVKTEPLFQYGIGGPFR